MGIKRVRISNGIVSSTEIAIIYQYERWFFDRWYRRIILLPKHIHIYLKHYKLLREEG